MMMRHQRAAVRECRMNRRKDQETGNAGGSNRTSMEAWGKQGNKGEHLICSLYFDFLNANWFQKTPLGIVPDFSNEDLLSKNGIFGLQVFSTVDRNFLTAKCVSSSRRDLRLHQCSSVELTIYIIPF
jgi:hypothetical protein